MSRTRTLESFAAYREAADPEQRLAGLVAEAMLHTLTMSMGQHRLLAEAIYEATEALVDQHPAWRRELDSLTDELLGALEQGNEPALQARPPTHGPLEWVVGLAACREEAA